VQFDLDRSDFREGELMVMERPTYLEVAKRVVAALALITWVVGVVQHPHAERSSGRLCQPDTLRLLTVCVSSQGHCKVTQSLSP